MLVLASDVISGFLKVYRLARSSCWFGEGEGSGLSLAVVRDLRVVRASVTLDDLAALETDVLAWFVLARAAAGLADSTIASNAVHLEQVRAWSGERCGRTASMITSGWNRNPVNPDCDGRTRPGRRRILLPCPGPVIR